MLEHFIEFMLPEIVFVLEIIGIAVITIGSLKAFYHYIEALFTHRHYPVRIELANAPTLGLEFKTGIEIPKTVLIRNFSEIHILGAITLLCAFLSSMTHFEIKTEKEHRFASEASSNNY